MAMFQHWQRIVTDAEDICYELIRNTSALITIADIVEDNIAELDITLTESEYNEYCALICYHQHSRNLFNGMAAS